MQALDIQPSNPTPYTPSQGPYNVNPTPGAGGLPALSGLSTRMNPMARELQNMGRGDDKMLVHMTPEEVNSLQGLALQTGTTMTINPNTGLPEAGLLGSVFKKLLPALVGGGLMFIPGVNAIAAAGIVGGGSTLLTGSLKKGLMAGLSAYGGASLARGLGAGVQAASGATTGTGIGAGTGSGVSATRDAVGIGSKFGAGFGGAPGVSAFAPGAAGTGLTSAVNAGTIGTSAAKTGLAALPGKFSTAARAGLPAGILSKAAPMAAGLGLINTVGQVDQAIQQNRGGGPEEQNTWKYEGPYRPMERRYNPRPTGPTGEGEISFFDYSNPYPGYLTATGGLPSNFPAGATATGFADGGNVKKPTAEDILKGGYIDPVYGEQQLAAGAAPGSTSNLGGFQFIVNPQGRWEAYTPPPPPPPPASPPPVITATTQAPLTPAERAVLTGGTTTGGTPVDTATKIVDTESPRRDTQTVQTAVAGPSGYGVETLKEVYSPNFTKQADYVTPAVKPYTVGSEMAQRMPELVNMYRTSPGAITAPLQYPGGTFNQQVRAQIAATPRQPTALDKFMADYYAKYGAPPTGYGDIPPGDMSYAKGGVHMDDGAFVVDARTVSELGNGSSSAGQELLARLGGRPVKGPGDGVSDSIPAKIGGTQEARVARDEVIFPAAAVKRIGGAKKLYALMDKAHKARKKADRGEDTKLRKGLGAL